MQSIRHIAAAAIPLLGLLAASPAQAANLKGGAPPPPPSSPTPSAPVVGGLSGGGGSNPGRTITGYSSIPLSGSLPGTVPSQGFEAQGVRELGDYVRLGSAGTLQSLSVVLTEGACQSRPAGVCTTAPGATFQFPITMNIYNVNTSTTPVTVGSRIATATQTVTLKYRPSSDPSCPGLDPGWSPPACYQSLAQTVTFPASAFGAPQLPSNVIWTIAFNTTHAGYNPIGEGAPCYGTTAGCPYDSLNAGLDSFGSSTAFAGTDVEPGNVFLNATDPAAYCSPLPVGVLRDDPTFVAPMTCWTDYRPLARIGVTVH